MNKAKVARKIIQCALERQDYETAREVHKKMPESSRDEPVTRYLMYKAGLRGGDEDFAAECLDRVCRSSAKDATLLYACVMEAQSAGSKKQAICALEKVLEQYEHSAPVGIHLPALLRSTARMLESELIKDGKIDNGILCQICAVFEGACAQAKASRTRPSTPAKELFTAAEFEWFSKNAYNISLKYCAEMPPGLLVRLLNCCIEVSRIDENARKVPNPLVVHQTSQRQDPTRRRRRSLPTAGVLRVPRCVYLYHFGARRGQYRAKRASRVLPPASNS
jgi:hypothetical protein